MAGKVPRKSGKATAKPSPGIGGKNIQKIKLQAQRNKKTTSKIPKSTRRFSLASDSSLSSVSADEKYQNVAVFDSSSDEEERNVEMKAIMGPSSSSSEEDDVSSEDDSDVDFVALTKEKKARAYKAAKSRKNPRKSNKGPKQDKKHKSSNEVVKEIDFEFQFDDDGNETFQIGEKNADDDDENDDDDDENDGPKNILEEEDLGEEIPAEQFTLMDSNYEANLLSDNNLLKNHLMMDVPKIKEDELNSDEDYEIDDDKLIATLQNDNDDLELAMADDDDDDNDESEPGEELLDANEFDNLSFEGEEDIDDYDELIENAEEDLDEDNENYLLKEETNAITKDFNSSRAMKLKLAEEEDEEEEDGFLKYLSEDSILFNDEDEDNDKLNSDIDEESYELTFFGNNFKDQDNNPDSRRHNKIPKAKFSISSDTRNEFHWPYVKKHEMDNDDDDSSFYSSDEDEDDDNEEELQLRAIAEQQIHSGDSTDEDTSLSKKANKKLNGGKMVAKEVLSTSETAPPLLGKWKTSDINKPYSIIDGLSTRSLNPETTLLSFATGSTPNKKPRSGSVSQRQKPKLANSEEPMAIDDLLNMSGLEDEDEVISEVDNVGFVFGKKVPLSAFRNKGYVPTMADSMDQLRKFTMNNKRLINKAEATDTLKSGNGKHVNFKFDDDAYVKKSSRKKRKERKASKLRRASIVEAAKEGLRTTKSGLFSESTIAGVEAFLADVDTGDEFSILFRGVM